MNTTRDHLVQWRKITWQINGPTWGSRNQIARAQDSNSPRTHLHGATLKPAVEQVKRLTGVAVKEAFVDKGYRGSEHHPEGVSVYLSGRKNLGRRLTKLLKRRSAIEPVIGHTKHDHGMERNHLLGKAGDRINALLSGCGWNLKKLWRELVENPRPCLTT